jgi:hypothetical protein
LTLLASQLRCTCYSPNYLRAGSRPSVLDINILTSWLTSTSGFFVGCGAPSRTRSWILSTQNGRTRHRHRRILFLPQHFYQRTFSFRGRRQTACEIPLTWLRCFWRAN